MKSIDTRSIAKIIFFVIIICSYYSCHIINKKNIYHNAVDAIYKNDSLILHYSEYGSKLTPLFDISPKTSSTFEMTACAEEEMIKYFEEIVVKTNFCFEVKRILKNEDDLMFRMIPRSLRQETTESNNWLIFTKYNKKYNVLVADIYLNIADKYKSHNMPYLHTAFIVHYTIFFDKRGNVIDIFSGTRYL